MYEHTPLLQFLILQHIVLARGLILSSNMVCRSENLSAPTPLEASHKFYILNFTAPSRGISAIEDAPSRSNPTIMHLIVKYMHRGKVRDGFIIIRWSWAGRSFCVAQSGRENQSRADLPINFGTCWLAVREVGETCGDLEASPEDGEDEE